MTQKKNIPSQEEILLNIDKKLGAITRLLAMSLPNSINQDQKIMILSEMGIQPKDIAIILGTTSNTVSVELTKMRKVLKKDGEKNG